MEKLDPSPAEVDYGEDDGRWSIAGNGGDDDDDDDDGGARPDDVPLGRLALRRGRGGSPLQAFHHGTPTLCCKPCLERKKESKKDQPRNNFVLTLKRKEGERKKGE